MRYPPPVVAMVRWIVWTVVGLGLFWILPDELLGSATVLPLLGASLTWANAIGIAIMCAAWIYFAVALGRWVRLWYPDALCRALALACLGATVTLALMIANGLEAFALGVWALTATVQVVLALRAQQLPTVRGRGTRAAAA